MEEGPPVSGVPYQVPITSMTKEHHRASSPHLLGQVGVRGGGSDSHLSCHLSCVGCHNSKGQQATSPKQPLRPRSHPYRLHLGSHVYLGNPTWLGTKHPPLGSTQST